jgi:hypothetical protein
MGTGRATQTPNPQQYRGDLAGGRGIFLPLSVLKRLPTRVPQSCLSRNHMRTAGSDTGAKAKGAKRPVLRDLPGLCADTPKRTRVTVALIEESAGPERQGVGRVDLWRHLPSESVLGPMQCAKTRIDSQTLMNLLEAGVFGNLTLTGKKAPTLYAAIT